MERSLIHGEGDRFGKPFRLLPWQREFNWRWYELHPDAAVSDELWWYLDSQIGAERGAVKTEFLAGQGHLEMSGPVGIRRESTPLVDIAAASYEQAGQLFRQAQIMAGGSLGEEIESAPLFGLYDVFDKEITFRSGRPGRMQRLAAIAGTNEGGKTSLFLADELAEWTGRKARVFTVGQAATSKRTPVGRTIGISMSGARKGSIPPKDLDPLLWRRYARGLLERDDPMSRYLFDWVAASEKWNLDDIDECRSALREMRGADITWSVEHRAREIVSRSMPRHEAKRLYLMQWAELGSDSWLLELPGVWEECADENAVPLDGSDVVVGVDMALHSDSVGVVVAGLLSDGRVGWWSRAWAPKKGKIDHADVFNTIAGGIAQRWKIKAITYDPRFFELPANMLEDQGFTVIEVPQSPERLVPIDGLLFNLLADHQIAHVDDPTLNQHVSNGAWRDSDRGRFFSKRLSGGHMDLLRAGAMATHELLMGSEADGHGPASFVAPDDGADSSDFFRPGRLKL